MSAFHDSEICRGILESLPSGLCVIDMQKKIVFWSDGAERITGLLRHEVIGHSCISETPLHRDQPASEFCGEDSAVARAIKTSHSVEATGFLRHKAGYEIPIRIRAVPVHNQHGSIIGAVETFEELQTPATSDPRGDGPNLPGCVDEVTNVASPSLMRSHLRETMATFVELHVPFGVLCLCLVGLPHFRASLGPEAASSLLRLVARSLENALWPTDFIGRWSDDRSDNRSDDRSDDQFLVILNNCSQEALPAVRERVRRLLAGDGIEWWGERRSLPLSIGQASAQPGDSIESLIERAQKSLETAKSLDTVSACRTQAASAAGGTSGAKELGAKE